MKILGVNPGMNGGLAVVELRATGPFSLTAIDVPIAGIGAKERVDAFGVQEFLLRWKPDHGAIEAQPATVRRSVSRPARQALSTDSRAHQRWWRGNGSRADSAITGVTHV
jgi:hypothetical protein